VQTVERVDLTQVVAVVAVHALAEVLAGTERAEVQMVEVEAGMMEVLLTLIHSRMLITLKVVVALRQTVTKQVMVVMVVDGVGVQAAAA